MKTRKLRCLLIGLALIGSGCEAAPTPDPIQSLSNATPNTERLVMFEETKEVWIRYNVAPEPGVIPPALLPAANEPESETSAPSPTLGSGAASPGFYTLQEGETAKCIARRYDLDWIKLYSMNGITYENEALIGTGKNLILPQNSHWLSDRYGERVSAPHPAQHPVVAGETLYSIACVYGDVTPEAIAVQNGLTSADQVVPGMTLSIP